jgi:hypothetical protein
VAPGAIGSVTQGRIDVALSQFARGYRNNALVGELLFPRVEVENMTDKYWLFGREGQKLSENALRAPGAAAERIQQTISTDNYQCNDHSLERLIPDEERGNFQAGDIDQWATQALSDKILLALENEIAVAAAAAGNYANANTTTLAGQNQWNDAGNSSPIADVEAGKSIIRQAGVEANLLIISDAVYQQLRMHPQIVERFKYTQPGAIGVAELQSVFGIPRIALASAVKLDGADVASPVWGKHAILAYSNPAASMMDASFGKLFVWRNAPNTVGGFSTEIARATPASRKADELAVHSYWAVKPTSNISAYAILNAVA